MDAVNPRTGRVDFQFEPTGLAELTALAQSARERQVDWASSGLNARIQALRDFARALKTRGEGVTSALTVDTGRRADSAAEVSGVVDAIEHWCARAPFVLATPHPEPTGLPFVDAQVTRAPFALVGAIAPWNFPLLMSFIDTLPALLCGSVVVIKPSEVTPRFVTPLREVIAAVPALDGVVNLVLGGAEQGRALCGLVDTVCFTGSVATGREIATAAAERLIPVHLELGGKDPAIVFEDADPKRTAAALCWGATANAGQSCLSIERAYVHASLFDEISDRVTTAMRAMTLSAPPAVDGDVGPIIHAPQAKKIERQIEEARRSGARVLCGGRMVRSGGVWCEPTVIVNVHQRMRIMQEETFGPVLPMMPFRDEAEAISLANDSVFGLSGAVFSADAKRLARVAQRLDVGAVSANDVCLTAFTHVGGKQAYRASGLGGTRMGDRAFARFFRERVVLDNTSLARQPWWFGHDSEDAGA